MPRPCLANRPARTPRRPARWLALLLVTILTVACSTQQPTVPAESSPVAQTTPTNFPAPLATTTAGRPTATPRPPSPTVAATRTRTPTRVAPTAASGGPTPTGVVLTQVAFTRVGLEAQAITTMTISGAVDEKDGQTLFVGGRGVYRSTDAGQTWTPIRSAEDAPRVTALAVASDKPKTIYIGVSEGCTKIKKQPGFVSKDGGATWRAIGDNLLTIVVDPKDSLHVYAITCTGLQQSTDGGGTWEPLAADRLTAFTQAVLIHGPTESQLLYVAWESAEGAIQLIRSNNGGKTWDLLEVGYRLTGLISLMFDPTDPRVLLLSTSQGLYRSLNGGKAWDALTEGLDATVPRNLPATAPVGYRLTTVLAGNPDRSGQFWVGTGTSKIKGVGVYRSTDNGATWSKTAAGLDGRIIQALTVGGAPNKRILYVATDDGLWSLPVP